MKNHCDWASTIPSEDWDRLHSFQTAASSWSCCLGRVERTRLTHNWVPCEATQPCFFVCGAKLMEFMTVEGSTRSSWDPSWAPARSSIWTLDGSFKKLCWGALSCCLFGSCLGFEELVERMGCVSRLVRSCLSFDSCFFVGITSWCALPSRWFSAVG